ncbi:MAG: signal peptidase II [Pseudomonadota bacterium]
MIAIVKNTGLKWLWIAVLALVLDQVTKLWILAILKEGDIIPVFQGFNIVLRYNPGAAFSFLADAGGWQRWFFTIIAAGVSVVLVGILYRLPLTERINGIAYSLVLGGAIGNLIDRLLYGKVVDFIDWYYGSYHWPAFNIADSAICIGVVLLIIDMLFYAKKRELAGNVGDH